MNSTPPPPPPSALVTLFPQRTAISDLHYHTYGTEKLLLITLSTSPELHILASNVLGNPNVYTLLHRFGGVRSCHGIAKLDTQNLVVLTSQSACHPAIHERKLEPGTFALWKVDLSHWSQRTGGVRVAKLADFPDAGLLNKVTTLPWADGGAKRPWAHCLLADSTNGAILVFDPNTERQSTWLSDLSMSPPTPDQLVSHKAKKHQDYWAPPITQNFGIAGITYFEGYVYYTNAFASTLQRVRVDPETLEAIPSTIELVVKTIIRPFRVPYQYTYFNFAPIPVQCVDIQVTRHNRSGKPIAYMVGGKETISVPLEGRRNVRAVSMVAKYRVPMLTCVAVDHGEARRAEKGKDKYRRIYNNPEEGPFVWIGTQGSLQCNHCHHKSGNEAKYRNCWSGGEVWRRFIGHGWLVW